MILCHLPVSGTTLVSRIVDDVAEAVFIYVYENCFGGINRITSTAEEALGILTLFS